MFVCAQAQSWLGFLQFTLIIFGQVPLTTMINMWYGNGIGLLNAQSSGKWYLGAGWNKDPMIECAATQHSQDPMTIDRGSSAFVQQFVMLTSAVRSCI